MPVEQLPGLPHDTEEGAIEPSPLVEPTVANPQSEHAQRGEFFRRMESFDQALREVERALEADPKDAHALATKGRILYAKNGPEDAVNLIKRAVRLDPTLDWALLTLTDMLVQLERENDAEEVCTELVNTHTDNAPAHGTFGRLLSRIGKLEDGTEHLEQAVKLRSNLAWLHAQLGEVQRRKGNLRSALDSFDAAESLAHKKELGSDVLAWIVTRKGLTLIYSRRYREAVETLDRALVLSPRYTRAMRLKARALWEKGESKQCYASLYKAIDADPNPTWAYVELVNYFRDAGQLEDALETLNACLRFAPKSADLLTRKGELLHRAGNFESAVQTLAKAEEIDEKDWRAFHLRGSALKYLGEEHNEEALIAEALIAIEKALEIGGNKPSVLVARADVQRAQGNMIAAKSSYESALEELDKRRRERPQSIEASTLWLMGWCLLWLDEDDQAFRLLAHAKSLDPKLYIARFYLGLALLLRGKTAQAEREYDAALKAIKKEKSLLLRRGILKSSLYALKVAGFEQKKPREINGKAPPPEQQILVDLNKELEKVRTNTDHQSDGISSTEAPTGSAVSEDRKDDSTAFETVPRRANLLVRPAADPMVPMVRLDDEFKIVDWNIAASLAFDETLEGRRGKYVGDWIVHFFDNPLAVAEHGQSAFGDQDRLPHIDVEDQEFTSRTYGKLSMTKRAFMIPNDDNKTCLGWLLIFELRFETREHSWRFKKNLTNELNRDTIWSAHAVSYDAVLSYSTVYEELLETITGAIGPLQRIPNGARVLDLGAGTGCLTLKLAKSLKGAFIVAVDNNNAMLDCLQEKCRPYMRPGTSDRGVVATRQDITELSRIAESRRATFDYAFLVNVLNTVSEPEKALKGVYELLKPGGEIRITGPRSDSKVEVLFDAIRQDLEKQERFEELEPYYKDLRALNADQLSKTFHWTTEDVEQMLLDVGFPEIISRGEGVDVYAGQGMLVAARR